MSRCRCMPSTIVTLTTDFGTRDGYVGAMKGVILGISPGASVVDITHDVPAQDIAHGAFVLGSAHRYFPEGAVHVAVVDPGVGTARRALVLVTPSGSFVAPDNGVLTYVVAAHRKPDEPDASPISEDREFLEPVTTALPEDCRAYVLNRPEYWLQPLSDTFHGRDLFAPVAAHLSRGVSAEELGEPVNELVCLHVPSPVATGDGVKGRIIHVDHYGNLVSNITAADMPGVAVQVEIAGQRISGISRSFAEGGELVAIIGSHSYLEVARRNGDGAGYLGAGVGSVVTVVERA